MKIGKYAYRESFDSHFFDFKTDKYLFTIEYAQTTENGWTSEPTYARGKAGAKVVTFNGNKESTYKMTTQLFPLQILAMFAGSDIETGKHEVYKSELLDVNKDNYLAEIEILTGATSSGNVTVVLSGVNHAVPVTASDTSSDVATAIASVIDAHANYTATASGSVITITPTSASNQLTASVNGTSTGVTGNTNISFDAFVVLSKTPIDTNQDGAVTSADVGVVNYENNVETDSVNVLTVDVGTKKVILDTSKEISDTVRVVYQWKTTSDSHRISFKPDKFPKYVKIVSDTEFADENGDLVSVQETKYKAQLKSNFTLSGSTTGDPTSLELDFDLLQTKVGNEDVIADMVFYKD